MAPLGYLLLEPFSSIASKGRSSVTERQFFYKFYKRPLTPHPPRFYKVVSAFFSRNVKKCVNVRHDKKNA